MLQELPACLVSKAVTFATQMHKLSLEFLLYLHVQPKTFLPKLSDMKLTQFWKLQMQESSVGAI